MPVTRRKNKASASEASASGKVSQVVSTPVVEQPVTHKEIPFDQDSSKTSRRGVMPHTKRRKDDGKAELPEPIVVEQKPQEQKEKDSHTQKNVVNMANRFANRKNKRTNNIYKFPNIIGIENELKKGDEIEIHFYEFYGAQSRMIAKVNGKELYYVKQDHPFNKTLEKFIGIGILNGHAIYMVYCAYREYVQGGRKKEEKAGA